MSHEEIDRRIDDQLRAAFAPLPDERIGELARRAVRPATPSRPPWPLWFLVTAAMCMLTWGLARRQAAPSPEAAGDVALGAMWVAAFEDATQRGFANCCDRSCGGCGMGAFDVSQACRMRFDAQLRMEPAADVQVFGTYEGLPTGGSMALLAQDGAAPMCLFVLPRAEDRGVELPCDKALHLARREVGELVVYALSKSPGASALDGFVAH